MGVQDRPDCLPVVVGVQDWVGVRCPRLGVQDCPSAGATGGFSVAGVTGLTAGQAIAAGAIGAAVGSVVSQGVAIAIGQQDSFSWNAVASAAITGGLLPVTPNIGGPFGQIANAVVGSAINQGVNIALGLQESFNWKAVAAAAVAAPVANWAGNAVGDAAGRAFSSSFAGTLARDFTKGMVNQVAYARFTGGKMDFTAMAADSFGNALGNSIVDGMAPQPIGVTQEQWADANRQLAAVNQGEFNDQLQRDVRQQQLQVSLQRDIERSLSNNPEFVANLPMPTAEYAESSNVPSAAGQAFATMWKNAQARAASGDLRVPAALSERDLQDAALNDPYSFLGTYAQARLSGSSMDAVRDDRLARVNAQAATGEIRALGDFEATLEFNPFARAALGVGVNIAEVLNTPTNLADGLGNLMRDAYGFGKDAIFGADPIDGPYQAQNSIVRLFQDEGAGRGAVSLMAGTVESLPIISLIASGGDPYEMGRSLPGTLGAMALMGATPLRLGTTLDPTEISFTQSWVSYQKAGAGYNFDTLVQGMKNDGWVGKPIDAVLMPDGTIASIDNTRVLAARQAGIQVQANVRSFNEPITDLLRQRTLTVNGAVPSTWGEAALMRIGKPTQNLVFPGWSERFPYGSIYDPVVR